MRIGLTLLLLAALLAYLLWPQAAERRPTAPQPQPAAADLAAVGNAVSEEADPDRKAPPAIPGDTRSPGLSRPASLADSEVDGAIHVDADGRLRQDLSLRRLFDHFLSTIGERSPEQIRALLADYLAHLDDPQLRAQVLASFERYVRYLQAVDEAGPRLAGLPLAARLDALIELRRQWLGEELAQAYFGLEEAQQAFTIAERALAADPALSPAERDARLQALVDTLPEEVRAPLLQHRAVDNDLVDAQAIDTLASDADERHRLRVQRYGEEAAARLEMLDRERGAWEARIEAYRQQRARLSHLDPAAREAALQRWLDQHLGETEQRRIRSLEAIGEI